MKLYKDGQEVLIDKSQLKVLLEAGWSMTKETEDVIDSASEEEVDEVKVTTIAKPKKTIRKPKKISLKE